MAGTIILAAQIYAGIGAALAAAFLTLGLGRIDPSARGVWTFRPLLIPGVVVLWPLVALRWWRLETGGGDAGAAHRPPLRGQARAALALSLAIPVLIAAALVLRQDGPVEAAAVRLEAPQ